MVRYMAM